MQKNVFDAEKYINSLRIKKSLKEILFDFNKQIDNIYEKKENKGINILIQNMPENDIKIIHKYVLSMMKRKGYVDNFISQSKIQDIEKYKNKSIVIKDFDEFEEEFIAYRRDFYDTEKFFSHSILNNNIVVFFTPKMITHKSTTTGKANFINERWRKLLDQNIFIVLSGKKELEEDYNLLMKIYKKHKIDIDLPKSDFIKLVDKIDDRNTYYIRMGLVDYLYDYSIKKLAVNNEKTITTNTFSSLIDNNYHIEQDDNEERRDDTKKEQIAKKNSFNNLIGLTQIKSEIDSLKKYVDFNKKLGNEDNMYLNLFFLGNPGTGKTTVARMFADELYDMGLLKTNDLKEVTPNDLIGEYVGHTKKKIRELLRTTSGKLLFIDEAYLLFQNTYSTGKNPFMEEAVVELIKYLEDPKNIVIFAGYTDEMRELYKSNPGFKSRIYKEIVFDDYTSSELYKILEKSILDNGLKIDKSSKKNIIKYIDSIKKDKYFGNARSMKKLSQTMIMNHINRKNKEDEFTLDSIDLPVICNNKQKKMGFGEYYG